MQFRILSAPGNRTPHPAQNREMAETLLHACIPHNSFTRIVRNINFFFRLFTKTCYICNLSGTDNNPCYSDLARFYVQEYSFLKSNGTLWARPRPFPVWQLTVRRWAAGDCGHSKGIYSFLKLRMVCFSILHNLSPCVLDAVMALLLCFLFGYTV